MSEVLAKLEKVLSGENVEIGEMTVATSATTKITLGYKPSKLLCIFYKDTNHYLVLLYSADISTSQQIRGYRNGAGTGYSDLIAQALPNTEQGRLKSVDNDGFTITAWGSTTTTAYGLNGKWYAMK